MSNFTYPAGAAVDRAQTYIDALLAELGDRDPLEVLGEQDAALHALIDGSSDAELRRREAPGKWAISNVVQHLADSDVAAAWRLRMILAQDEPPIAGYDQDAWSARLHSDTIDLDDTLLFLRILRKANLELVRRFARDELHARAGIHAERGRESAWRLLELMAAHDIVHRRQIARIKAAR